MTEQMEITPREIKFRVWDSEKKRMSKPVEIFQYIIQWNDGDIDTPTVFALTRDRFIFLQFTGLKDKNGKEIYEGDTIQNVADDGSRLSVYKVLYDLNRGGFCKSRIDTNDRYMLEPSRFYEVIETYSL